MNFAVIKTGGKQYKVAANDVLKIEKLDAQPGDVVTFDQVLMVGNGDDVTVGAPLVSGASVVGHILHTKKQATVLIVKKHRRQHFDRRNGHRQLLSTVRIGEILIGGTKTSLVADEKLKAAALATSTQSVSSAPVKAKKAAKVAAPMDEPAAEAAPETKAPAKKAAKKAPAADTAEKPAKKAPAKKAAKTETTEGEKPAAKKAAKKAAPKAKE
jgi:large subunit ribosomal protein L21